MLIEVILPVAAILVVVVLLNCPIYVGILGAAVYLQVFVNQMPLQTLFTGMFEALNKTNLLSVPFFVFLGGLIAATSLGDRLIKFFVALLRRVRGGMPIACVLANALFGAISGASSAAVATFGKVTYEPLKRDYGDSMAMGIITSSASLSSVIPPSITMILYCVCSEESLTDMFKTGVLPGILIVLLVSIYIVLKSRKVSVQETARQPGELRRSFVKGLPVLVLPIIVLGSIYGGICSATEIGAVASVYCLIVGFTLRELNFKKLRKVCINTAEITAQVFLLVAASSVFSQAATVTQLPQYIASLFDGTGKIMFLIMINILLLIMGCLFDTSAAILIFVPMLLPAATLLGIHPLQLGMIFVLNLSIGKFTPPFGMNIFVAQSVLKRSFWDITKACFPYVGLYLIALVLVTFIPQLSLLLV